MLKQSLVYIHAADDETFVGCGAYIEQNLIVTCRHVWRDAGEQAKAVFPHLKRNGAVATSPLQLFDACKGRDGDDPDIVLLRAGDPPDGLTELQVARDQLYEIGQAKALARLPTRNTDREIPGTIGDHVDDQGRRAFNQPVATGYWLERGSSGSPIFVGTGQQLAGLISMAELGDEPQNAPIREAYVIPGTIIWPFIRAVMERERAQQRTIEWYENERQSNAARELIYQIARSLGGAPESFEQALSYVRATLFRRLEAGGEVAQPVAAVTRRSPEVNQLRAQTSLRIFLSGVSDEFGAYRDQLNKDLTRHNVSVKVQEDFKDLSGDTLDTLDVYIAHCDAVVHLLGDMCGATAGEQQQRALLAKHPDLLRTLPPLGDALNTGVHLPYTHWEAWLALYHGRPLVIAKAADGAPRGPRFAPNSASRAAQMEHIKRLRA
jgi:hypothetical protein